MKHRGVIVILVVIISDAFLKTASDIAVGLNSFRFYGVTLTGAHYYEKINCFLLYDSSFCSCDDRQILGCQRSLKNKHVGILNNMNELFCPLDYTSLSPYNYSRTLSAIFSLFFLPVETQIHLLPSALFSWLRSTGMSPKFHCENTGNRF